MDPEERNQLITATVDPAEWMLEVERVVNKLKYNPVTTESKEWRQHLDSAKNY